MSEAKIYEQWEMPFFAPPAEVFGPVWTVLYAIIIVTFGYTIWQIYSGYWPKKILWPMALNIVSNLLFTPIQFGLQSLWLAMIDILVVLVSLIWLLRMIWPHSRAVVFWNIPYLLWVSFATILQVSITLLNVGIL